jgi:hypothetical protein
MGAMKPTYGEFFEHFLKYKDAHPEQRYGQALFNALYEVAPDLANEIRATARDPFHDQSRVAAFTEYVALKLGAYKGDESGG